MSETRRSRLERPRRGRGGDLSYRHAPTYTPESYPRPIEDRVLERPPLPRRPAKNPHAFQTPREIVQTLRSWWDRFTEPFTFMFRWVRKLVLWFMNWHPLGGPGR